MKTLSRRCWTTSGRPCRRCSGSASDSRKAERRLKGFGDPPDVAGGPTQLPQVNGFNVCADYRFVDRDIENLQVPDAATCVLEAGVRIDGNVELGTASEFHAQAVSVGGNVQGQRAAAVLLENSTVGGNLQCKENVPAPAGGGNIVQGNREDQCARL